ncbi:RING-10 protein [Massarina eburnea CBS 473.64]|uniref:RING-10 protein n=1 Tax=Massarina eburnea CBS 473.64 TaxID=1395130 RepID=A0A6A6S862_9PLEO|nr:RING-10 protein [Massarina eburnea CBS 473.64]
MPAYFFHLAFELYPSPSSAEKVFTPPLPPTDIFSELPAHAASTPWSSPPIPRRYISKTFKPLQGPEGGLDTGSQASSSDPARHRPQHARRISHRTRPSFSEPHDSPVPIVKPTTRPSIQSAAHKDWRFGVISILSIDMSTAEEDAGRPRAKSLKHPATSTGGLATKGKFIPSDLKDTEVGWGVMHLYRDGQETPGLYDGEGAGTEFDEQNCTTLCILAVPSYMTPSDLLGFVGEQTREDVSHFRLIRTARANKYTVLMKFREAKKAREWRKEWNGKSFNSMEPEYCHVVFVKSITFRSDPSNRDPSSYPNLTNDPFTPVPSKEPTAPLPGESSVSSPVDPPSLASTLTAKPLAPPTPALIELPTCPVCLERMDETTGLLTILCQHVFHCACLEKWRGSGCPVCRYTQNDAFTSHNRTLDGETPENECSVCRSTENLWICLICGNIGCGRYDSAHAFAHYEATSHTYAMDVVSQHVWDYAGDGYVHRLIQNKADGKLVDLPASAHTYPYASGGMTGYANDTVPREKVDNMGMEYTYLLTSQLESQRAYFEEQVERAVDKAAKATATADEASRKVASLTSELDWRRVQYSNALTNIETLEKEVSRTALKAQTASDLARKLTKEVKEEKIMNESLMTRISHLVIKSGTAEERAEAAERQMADLEEQNRDLSFFISGQQKLKEMQGNEVMGLEEGEVQSGYLEVGKKEEKGKRKGKGRKT